jgi:hypothetical protein
MEFRDCRYDSCPGCPISGLPPEEKRVVLKGVTTAKESLEESWEKGLGPLPTPELTSLCRFAVHGRENVAASFVVFTAMELKNSGQCAVPD